MALLPASQRADPGFAHLAKGRPWQTTTRSHVAGHDCGSQRDLANDLALSHVNLRLRSVIRWGRQKARSALSRDASRRIRLRAEDAVQQLLPLGADQAGWVSVADGITFGVCVGVDAASEPDGIGLGIPPNRWIVVPIPVVPVPGFSIKVLD